MPGESVVTKTYYLDAETSCVSTFSSLEVTLGQMRKIGIHFIIYPKLNASQNRPSRALPLMAKYT